jgi:hypothetical protein
MSLMAIQYVASTAFPNVRRLMYTIGFVGGFFTFGFGSLVYLRFESDLRTAVGSVRLGTLARVQAGYCGLSSSRKDLSAEEWIRLTRLKRTSDHLSRSGYFRGTWLSLPTVLAILPPLVSLIGALLIYKKKSRP